MVVAVKVQGLRELETRTREAVLILKREARQAGREGGNLLRKEERHRTRSRRVGRSIRVKFQSDWSTKVSPSGPLAHIEEGGARPHVIRPRKKRFLFIGGRFVTGVRHPGRAARPFVQASLHAAMPAIQEGYQKALDRAANEIARS